MWKLKGESQEHFDELVAKAFSLQSDNDDAECSDSGYSIDSIFAAIDESFESSNVN